MRADSRKRNWTCALGAISIAAVTVVILRPLLAKSVLRARRRGLPCQRETTIARSGLYASLASITRNRLTANSRNRRRKSAHSCGCVPIAL